MLLPISYCSHHMKSSYEMGVNMMLQAVFTMFVDFKNWVRGNIGRKYQVLSVPPWFITCSEIQIIEINHYKFATMMYYWKINWKRKMQLMYQYCPFIHCYSGQLQKCTNFAWDILDLVYWVKDQLRSTAELLIPVCLRDSYKVIMYPSNPVDKNALLDGWTLTAIREKVVKPSCRRSFLSIIVVFC